MLATEPYKTKDNLSAPTMHEIFEQRNIQYNLRSQPYIQLGSVKTITCCLRALKYVDPKIWNTIPFEIKKFRDKRRKIKSWKPEHCTYLYQPYFYCLGYI